MKAVASRFWQLINNGKGAKVPPINWPQIIAAVIAAIQGCMKPPTPTPTPATLRAHITNPGPIQELRNQRLVRTSQGLSGADWRQHKNEMMAAFYAQASEATDDDLAELIDQAAA